MNVTGSCNRAFSMLKMAVTRYTEERMNGASETGQSAGALT